MRPEDLFKKTVEDLTVLQSSNARDAAHQVIFVKMVRELDSSIDQLRASMEANAKSSDVLAIRVHRLNVVLTWATTIGALAAVAGVVVAFTK